MTAQQKAQKTVFMFAGQGSQHFQMGRSLFEGNQTFHSTMRQMDSIVRDRCGESLIDGVYAPERRKHDPMDRTTLSHPAIFAVQYSLAQSLLAAGVFPDFVLGASLGSFVAATVGGYIDAEEALIAVIRQAQIFETHCPAGGMIAVIGDDALRAHDFLRQRCELAASTFTGHFVLACPRTSIAVVTNWLKARGVTFQELPVSFAYHSSWIDGARQPYEHFLATLRLRSGRLPLICCARAKPLESIEPAFFWRVAREPIRFRDAIAGLERDSNNRYIDLGPGGTLATFLKYLLVPAGNASIHSIMSPYDRDLENLAALMRTPP